MEKQWSIIIPKWESWAAKNARKEYEEFCSKRFELDHLESSLKMAFDIHKQFFEKTDLEEGIRVGD